MTELERQRQVMSLVSDRLWQYGIHHRYNQSTPRVRVRPHRKPHIRIYYDPGLGLEIHLGSAVIKLTWPMEMATCHLVEQALDESGQRWSYPGASEPRDVYRHRLLQSFGSDRLSHRA